MYSVSAVARYWLRTFALSLALGGLVPVLPFGLPTLSAQTSNNGIGFGNTVNTLTPPTPVANSPFAPGIQEARLSLAGWQAYRTYRQGLQTNANAKEGASQEVARFGPVRMALEASAGTSYDTNINSSPTNPLPDVLLYVQIQMQLRWQATRRNELQLTLGLNYTQYLENPEYNDSGLLLAPYTGLDYRIYFLDFVLTLYDYPSITNNGGPRDPAITNSVNFRQFTNRGGLSLLWHANHLALLTGFERSDTLSLTNDEFNSQNSTAYSWYGMASWEFTPTTTAGLRLQAVATNYTQEILNNSVTTETGLFYQSQLTDYTSFYIEAGIQTGNFFNTGKETNTLVFEETNGFNTNVEGTLGGKNYVQPYFRLMLTNKLNKYLNQTLSLSRMASGSTVSNYQESNNIGYQLQYRLNRFTSVGGRAAYQFGTISRNLDPVPFSTLMGQLDFSFHIMKNTDFGISYTYYKNDLAELDANYTRQVFTLSISHRF